MPDDRTYDEERLLGRLEGVADGVRSLEGDLARLHRLATVGVAAGMVAHEIRGVMSPVKAYAQLALRSLDDPAMVAKALARAEEGADRAVRIAESILALVGAAQRTGVGEGERVTVEGVVGRALDSLVRDPGKDGVRVRLEVEAGLVVAMDPVELQQVIVNLATNAVRAMGGGGVLTIRACSTGNADDRRVRLEVRDTGPGLAPEVAARVFRPFVSVGAGPSGGGTGLGLALCRELVEGAGGSIGVESAPGRGATFTVEVPADPSDQA